MRIKLSWLLCFTSLFIETSPICAEPITLYVDKKTKQVFTEAGPNRVKLDARIMTEGDVEEVVAARSISTTPAAAQVPDTLPASSKGPVKKEWYDRLSVRGYTQFRSTFLNDDDKVKWYHPADRTVAPDQTFNIRRGRLILSGDAAEHLFLYVQPEMNASPSDGDFSTQLRDMYGDIALDDKKESRIRIGQSKVPFGFVNLQSSQNRLAMERPDALNSAAEGERDIGAFYYWAPKEIRERFGSLVRDGLKGSGDYGVFALGAYNGQGLNRSDSNDSPHVIARASYPFKFDNGQIFEPGIQAYAGKFVPRTREISIDGSEELTTPKFNPNGIQDKRAGISAVLYPQPFGFEAEWNIGKGPELSSDYTTIEEKSLHGGYILANYRIKTESGADLFPFARWQYYDGGRKFGRNSPHSSVNEFDIGVEFAPWKEVEFTAMYTYSKERTNTNDFSYGTLQDESRVAVQAQINY
jgi:Phosphate-selective porin O and P